MLPFSLIANLTPTQQQAAHTWWLGLPKAIQEELAAYWDQRADSCAFAHVCEENEKEWQELPIAIGAHFFPKDEPDSEDGNWNRDFYEYLVNHPELAIHVVNVRHHICRAHPLARAALRQGRIPADFACPLAQTNCPMRELLASAPGKSLQLFWMPKMLAPA